VSASAPATGPQPLPTARPRTRGDCAAGPRPCPWVSCRHHLFLEVRESGGIKLNFPHLEVWAMGESCSLDVADRGTATLEQAGRAVGLTRERVRQIESRGKGSFAAAARALG